MTKLRNTKTLALAAMLTAIGIILSFFKIPVNQLITIGFGSLPLSVSGMLLGPAVSGVVGALMDIGGYLVKPTGPFFPGFTISGIVSGIIYGLMFYKKKITFTRVLVAQVILTIVVNILMNSYWLKLLYLKDAYFAVIISRLPKEVIMLPIMTVMKYIVLKTIQEVKVFHLQVN
ncbi:MAG: folate family ECF transporter S component [Pseudobutyrivibrio sp.]|nr:folate family ECF transporter S component [Pseudobutyrivibrio sp.]